MKNLFFTALLLCFVLLVRAQEFKNKDLQSLVTAEIDFAKLAKTKNNREAFLANVDQSSLTLNENIESTRNNWQQLPVDSIWLNWYPSFADISSSGDLGYTFGPWSGHPNKKAPADFGGQYITLWKKQSNGVWKIAIDAGITNNEKSKVGGTIKTTSIKTKAVTKSADPKKELLDAEQSLQSSLKESGVTAYETLRSTECQFFRANAAPFTNLDAEKIGSTGVVKQLEGYVSNAGDLGYTYGLVYADALPGTPSAHRTFLRIWKKEDGKNWKLVVDALFGL